MYSLGPIEAEIIKKRTTGNCCYGCELFGGGGGLVVCGGGVSGNCGCASKDGIFYRSYDDLTPCIGPLCPIPQKKLCNICTSPYLDQKFLEYIILILKGARCSP